MSSRIHRKSVKVESLMSHTHTHTVCYIQACRPNFCWDPKFESDDKFQPFGF